MTVTTPPPPPLPDELEALLRRLRLPYVRRAAPEVIATANSQRWEHAEVLKVLLAEEAAGRDHATTSMRRRSSGLPAGKTFDAWEPGASAIPPQTQQALRTLEWIDRAEVLCVCGPSGTGKSHFVEALGHLAIDRGKTVAWHTLETLAQLVHRHRADDSVNKAVSKLIRADLVIIDDVGLLPVSTDAAEALFLGRGPRRRDALDRDQLQHPPARVRRADAQDARDSDRRPAAAPRARPDHRRVRQLPARPGNRREGSHAPALTNRKPANLMVGRFVATSGEKTWPPVGRNDGRSWGETDGH